MTSSALKASPLYWMVPVYVGSAALANLLIYAFGPWFSPINAFFLIGLDLAIRDSIHDRWQGPKLWSRMFFMIASAGILSYTINPAAGIIAIASVAAFAAGSFADAGAYQAMRRMSWLRRSNGSNAAGAAVDSVIFPTLAFGVIMPEIIAAQFIAKIAGGALWSLMLSRRK